MIHHKNFFVYTSIILSLIGIYNFVTQPTYYRIDFVVEKYFSDTTIIKQYCLVSSKKTLTVDNSQITFQNHSINRFLIKSPKSTLQDSISFYSPDSIRITDLIATPLN